MTDRAFQNAIDAVSADGQLRWGVEHLYYEVCRRKKGFLPSVGCLVFLAALFVFFLTLFARDTGSNFAVVALIAGAIFALFIWLRMGYALTVRIPLEKFNKMWARWVDTHGTPARVIIRRKSPKAARDPEPDLGDYSFDRAVICDRARTVDLLLANNFHFENNCAVLSVGGYPEGPFETVRNMLKRNPRLQVFVLHDARPLGCKLAYRLANDPNWFKGHLEVKDVGLRPHHSRRLTRLWLPSDTPHVSPGEFVTAKEAKWLSRYHMELAVMRPERILRALFKSLNPTEESDSFG